MAADGRKHILAIGGGALMPRQTLPFHFEQAIKLSGKARPRICVLDTAAGDNPASTLRFYDRLADAPAEIRHLALFPMPNVADPEDFLLSQDVVWVGGGSVANMLAVWRVHGLDEAFRKAWEAGVVLMGSSAGGICWFEGGTTDSFGPDLRPFTDGLGMLKGSYCPHYESEERRRPLFHRLVQEGALPDGFACDDGVALHYVDDELAEVVADRPEGRAFTVRRGRDGADGAEGSAVESALPVRFLGAPE
jgi:peptidase E